MVSSLVSNGMESLLDSSVSLSAGTFRSMGRVGDFSKNVKVPNVWGCRRFLRDACLVSLGGWDAAFPAAAADEDEDAEKSCRLGYCLGAIPLGVMDFLLESCSCFCLREDSLRARRRIVVCFLGGLRQVGLVFSATVLPLVAWECSCERRLFCWTSLRMVSRFFGGCLGRLDNVLVDMLDWDRFKFWLLDGLGVLSSSTVSNLTTK